ncbi:MAG: (2Fe-2S)-binding protein, partial [Bdellovibrionales bacterium]|nr:(2Fe-2S)-binding protein [Bdellovibrionales bacterium]
MIQFKLNGKRIRYDGNPEKSLLKYLREELMITTPKDGCSG